MTAPHGASRSNGGSSDSSDRSLGELFSEVTKDLSTLMRQEVELAKAEVRQEAARAGQAAGLLGGAGVSGLLTAIFASLAAMFGLRAWMDIGWAALIVAVVWGIVGAVLFSSGRARLKTVNPVPQRTVETIKEDVQWTKNRAS